MVEGWFGIEQDSGSLDEAPTRMAQWSSGSCIFREMFTSWVENFGNHKNRQKNPRTNGQLHGSDHPAASVSDHKHARGRGRGKREESADRITLSECHIALSTLSTLQDQELPIRLPAPRGSALRGFPSRSCALSFP